MIDSQVSNDNQSGSSINDNRSRCFLRTEKARLRSQKLKERDRAFREQLPLSLYLYGQITVFIQLACVVAMIGSFTLQQSTWQKPTLLISIISVMMGGLLVGVAGEQEGSLIDNFKGKVWTQVSMSLLLQLAFSFVIKYPHVVFP